MKNSAKDFAKNLPAATFHILLSLADRDGHGYSILQEITNRTDGAVKLGAATLYRSIQRMLNDGLIQETRDRPPPDLDDERRRYYRITELGREVAVLEVERLQSLVNQATACGFKPVRGPRKA